MDLDLPAAPGRPARRAVIAIRFCPVDFRPVDIARPVSRLHPIGHLPERSARLWWRRARQKNPHPPGSLAFAAWVLARLGGWTGYYGKPGPVVMLRGLVRFHAIKHGWDLRNV